ncbi:cytochrome-c peroxidase [Fischerella sp. PCC 9605]|uniref:cytochrome-c peroxidase n=1 Tax=Fischerella sp. PCC 9605 TaxID=1173024 RepID=UPI0004BACEBB|nr:cytochrome c peroxidase [Fischerella sp. PCC 9605]
MSNQVACSWNNLILIDSGMLYVLNWKKQMYQKRPMKFSLLNRRILRQVSLVALVILAILAAIWWQQIQTPKQMTVTVQRQQEIISVDEPIQPIPQKIYLNQNKVALGKKLFGDLRLSADNRISCLSCHHLSKGGADDKAFSIGVNGAIGNINAPTVYNAAFNARFNWNGRFKTLENLTEEVIQNPTLMGIQWQLLMQKLQQATEYTQAFTQNYADGLTAANVKDAIATYVRSLYTPNSRFDRYLRGNKGALTSTEKEGYRLFKAYGCVSCHQGMNVGGNLFQKFGIMGDYFRDRGNVTKADLGRYNVTQAEADMFVFRVPSLRNVALTAPYFHDGTAKTLEKAITVMAKYQLGRSLSDKDTDLIAQFLATLTREHPVSNLK